MLGLGRVVQVGLAEKTNRKIVKADGLRCSYEDRIGRGSHEPTTTRQRMMDLYLHILVCYSSATATQLWVSEREAALLDLG